MIRSDLLHRLVATQALLALALLGAAQGGAASAAAMFLAAGFLTILWVRVNERPLPALLRFRARRRTFRLGTPGEVLALTAPHTLVTTAELAGAPAAVLVDGRGLTVLLELTEPGTAFPAPHTLLPEPEPEPAQPQPDQPQPRPRVQLVLTGIPAALGAGPAAGSYRSLVPDGPTPLGRLAVMLAIRLPRTEGWPEEELRHMLLTLARRVIRQLRAHGARPLDRDAVMRTITGLAHAEPPDEARELWTALRLGGLHQATFHCRAGAGPVPARLLPRLLHLPVAATTVATVDDGLLIRLAAADSAALGAATRLLERLCEPEGIALRRWDGAHLAGLSATLPLGGGRPGNGRLKGVPEISAGLLLGRNRRGEPVPVALFRSVPTRLLVIGGLACAQLIVFRALATGARVTVHSTRPRDWTAFGRGAGAPITLLAAGRPPVTPAGSVRHPVLLVADSVVDPQAGEPWQTALVVRDHLTVADLDLVTGADLVVVQPLDSTEATLLGEALHLGDTAEHLTRMGPAMVALVSRSSVRWAALAPSKIERVLLGPIASDRSRYD